MRILDTALKNAIVETFTLDQGKVFTFENFLITEFEEGATVDQQCFLHLYQMLNIYSKGKENYGLISNRVHNYAVNTSDLLSIIDVADRKYDSAIVVYDEVTSRSTAFEIAIYQCGARTFTDLNHAISWISNKELAHC